MYEVGVWLYGVGELPTAFEDSELDPLQMIQRPDGTWKGFIPFSREQVMFESVVHEIGRLGQRIWNTYFSIRDLEHHFERESLNYFAPEVVAFRLTGDHRQQLRNCPDDFEPKTIPPCRGILKTARDLVVDEKPEGLLATVGHRLIASDAVFNWMKKYRTEFLDAPNIICNDKPVLGWKAIIEEPRLSCLEVSLKNQVQCFACGGPFVDNMGVLLGRAVAPETLEQDLSGWGHFGRERVLIASPDVAEDLEGVFGADAAYGIFPIFDVNGIVAQTIRSIMEQIHPFRGPHPAWKKLN